VSDSDERLHSVLVTLEGCRTALLDSGSRETAHLVSVAILELRMKLNKIADSELKALCDAMLPDDAPATPQAPKSSRARDQVQNQNQVQSEDQVQARRALLKLVK
jgi:hypothetical protein